MAIGIMQYREAFSLSLFIADLTIPKYEYASPDVGSDNLDWTSAWVSNLPLPAEKYSLVRFPLHPLP